MTSEKGGSSGGIDRRELLKTAAAGAVGVGAVSGVASAHPPQEIRFCGCSRVCVDSNRSYRVIYAVQKGYLTTCSIEPATSETEETSPKCFDADDDQTIIGVLGGARNVYWNPHACAETPLGAFSLDDCDGCDDDACSNRVTYWPVGPDEYEVGGMDVVVRTGNCDPPSEWERESELQGGIFRPL